MVLFAKMFKTVHLASFVLKQKVRMLIPSDFLNPIFVQLISGEFCGASSFSRVVFCVFCREGMSAVSAYFITSGLYYKHMVIVNDDSSIMSEQSFYLIDDARGVIYDRCMFIIQATGDLNARSFYHYVIS